MKLIKLQVFPFDIIFSQSPAQETIKFIQEQNICLSPSDRQGIIDFHTDGRCIALEENAIVILLPKGKIDVRTLVHETNHAALFILDSIGELPSIRNMETIAYLQEYIFNEILTNRTPYTLSSILTNKKQ